MVRLLKNLFKAEDGAIAVETAIVAPLMLIILLPSIDIGMQIHAMQKMNKATDSGIEYIVNGGRNESTLRAIVQDSFGQQISQGDLDILAYCGCIESSSGLRGSTNKEEDGEIGFYVKTTTQFSDNMCPTNCSNGESPSELVELQFTRSVQGAWKSKSVSSRLQTRIK